jgi:hypothetical protein
MPWYFYVLEFVSGLLLTNGVPHFVQGVCGNRFQSPFAYPPGIGESAQQHSLGICKSARWLCASLVARASRFAAGWIAVALGVLLAAVCLSTHFGRVRLQHPGFSDQRRRCSALREGVLD